MLSKSRILRGHQCIKSLYLYTHHRELQDELSEQQQMIFDKGTETGELAHNLFPGGSFGTSDGDIPGAAGIENTTRLIENDTQIIYEATFAYNDVIVSMDILVWNKVGWDIYEVKSSTSVKDINILDVAIQLYVLEGCELKINKTFIVHLNNQYVRGDTLDIENLFVKVDITDKARELLPEIPDKINQIKEIVQQSDVPDIDIGTHCNDPYDCDFSGHCWQHIPEPSVFNICRLRTNKKFDLYYSGIVDFADIPVDYPLNVNQKLQVDCHLNKTNQINIQAVRKFCSEFSYPLWFLDFETFQSPVPLYRNSRSYQQIPFQYSLHYKENEQSELQHFEFLGQIGEDPRPALIQQIVHDLGQEGDIVTYNASFEKTRVKEMARDFPEYVKPLNLILKRIKDLEPLFSKKHYYTPAMNGQSSIKLVLPALIPELSYKNIDIGSGNVASTAFLNLQTETDPEIIAKTRNDLLAYCKLDTYAMVRIWEILKGI